jgi:hypothetical protein
VKLERKGISRALGAAVVAVWLVGGAVTAEAFTLINVASITVSPKSGVPSAALVPHGKYGPGSCPQQVKFSIYWDSPLTSPVSSTTLAAGAPGCDPGPMAAFVPPSSASKVGPHTVILDVTDINANPMPNGYATTTYTITSPPPPPKPSPKPSPRPSPRPPSPSAASHPPSPSVGGGASPSPSQSPSAAACAATGALPPPSTGSLVDTFIAGAMVASVLPIVGFALFGASPVLAIVRRRRLLQLLGLAILLAATLSCDLTPSPTANASPSPSPSVCTGA